MSCICRLCIYVVIYALVLSLSLSLSVSLSCSLSRSFQLFNSPSPISSHSLLFFFFFFLFFFFFFLFFFLFSFFLLASHLTLQSTKKRGGLVAPWTFASIDLSKRGVVARMINSTFASRVEGFLTRLEKYRRSIGEGIDADR